MGKLRSIWGAFPITFAGHTQDRFSRQQQLTLDCGSVGPTCSPIAPPLDLLANCSSSSTTSLAMEKESPEEMVAEGSSSSSLLLSSMLVREESTRFVEARVMHEAEKMAEAADEERRRRLQARISVKIDKVDKRLKGLRESIHTLTDNASSSSSSSRRRLMALMDEEEVLLQQRTDLLKELDFSKGNDQGNDDDQDSEGEGGKDERLGKMNSVMDDRDEAIRRGTMTAFGTELKTNDDEDEEDVAHQYKNLDKDPEADEDEDDEQQVGEEEESKVATAELKGSSKRRREMDDGDRDVYLDRLQGLDDELGQKDDNPKDYERLDGGLLVPRSLWSKLFLYQRVGVQWLWELHQQGVGGILGDEMGLGKTIQIIAFLAALYCSRRRQEQDQEEGSILIVAPTTVMHQWVKEFHTWWPSFRVAILHESGSFKGSKSSLVKLMSKCSKGVLITSYNGLVAYQEDLTDANFDYLILDEGHKIRNPDAQVTLAAKSFTTAHRLILSGSPLQNNLKELWSLFDFVYPGKLGTLPVFMSQFSIPITQGGYANASRVQVATAFKCATILRDTINPYLLRRMKNDVRDHLKLPEKNEQVLFCRLTDHQREMYKNYLESKDVQGILSGKIQSFVGLTNLRKICNHPDLFKVQDGLNDVDRKEDDDDSVPQDFGYWRRSGKMIVVEALLKLWKKQEHRVLLFSQSRMMLQVLERLIKQRGYTYLRMDGSTGIGSRQPLIDRFNEDESIFVFLLTTKVGGLGVNLIGASRVVIFDPDWNPSTDMQARERAWRIGQQRQVTIYRLLMASTIEEKIYHRQIFKQYLVNRVLKDPSQKRFFKTNDLHELFTLNEAKEDNDTESSALFAGTGSEVQLKATKPSSSNSKRRRKRSKEGLDSDRTTKKWARPLKMAKIDADKNKDEKVKESLNSVLDENEEERRQRLLEQVRRINAQFKNSDGDNRANDNREGITATENQAMTDFSKNKGKKKKKKDGRFEGKSIPHLVKSRRYRGQRINEGDEKKGRSVEQDSYVLSKLFKRTGGMMHSALQHDVIESGGKDNNDFSLVEAEAERVAKEAIAQVRQSRSMCFRAEAGVPTFTGSSGFLRRNKLSKKKGEGELKTESKKLFTGLKSVNEDGFLSSSQLLNRIKARNRYDEGSETDRFVVSEQVELINDLRVFVQAQDEFRVSTKTLIDRFGNRLPSKDAPLFKALLKEVCDFSRVEGKGTWTLRTEFR